MVATVSRRYFRESITSREDSATWAGSRAMISSSFLGWTPARENLDRAGTTARPAPAARPSLRNLLRAKDISDICASFSPLQKYFGI